MMHGGQLSKKVKKVCKVVGPCEDCSYLIVVA